MPDADEPKADEQPIPKPLGDKPRWEIAFIVLTMLAALSTILAYLFGDIPSLREHKPPVSNRPPADQKPPVSTGHTKPDTTIVIPLSGRPEAIANLHPPLVHPRPLKKAFLGIAMAANGRQWDNNLSKELAALFTAKGYDPKETTSRSKEYSFDNLVTYNLTVSGLEEKRNASNTGATDYEFELTMEYYNGQVKTPCAHRIYHETVPRNGSDKDQVIIQGVAGLVFQVKKDTPFPFCIHK